MSVDARPGEIALAFDPSERATDAGLVFIGRARTPWTDRGDCPRNLGQARLRGGDFRLKVDPLWRAGLLGVEAGQAIVVLYWMDRARRDLIVQMPRHREQPAGVFSLRSPVRPNPIALSVVTVLACDGETGEIAVDALDCLDGTPLLDIKPWIAAVDVPPDR